MDKMQFNVVIPRIRVLETRLLDKSKLERMIDANSPEEAIKVLSETEYSSSSVDLKRAENYEVLLSEEIKKLFSSMYEMCPVKSVVDLMSIKYDYHNIKVIIKGKILDKDFSYMLIPVGKVDAQKLKLDIESDNLGDLPSVMREGIESAVKDFEEHKDPQRIDVIIDKYMFKEMKEISNQIKDTFVDKYVSSLIDTTNLKTLLRVKTQNKGRDFLNFVCIEGGKIGKDTILALYNDTPENIAAKLGYTDYAEILKQGIDAYLASKSANLFEKLADNYTMDMMKEAKYIPFGLEPVLAYIYAKETEIKVIRIIMVGKLNNITGEVIRERLRDIYV
ncbi:MAG: V-type ATP synthase subunit C [Clostridium sp.]